MIYLKKFLYNQYSNISIDGGIFFMSNKITKLKRGIEISNNVINDIMFLYQFRTKVTHFTRMGKSKMKFNNIILFMLNFVKKSLQLELDDFFKKIQKSDETISKQAFSQARRKVSPKAFV